MRFAPRPDEVTDLWDQLSSICRALDSVSGQMLRSIDVTAHAGTAFDGRHLFQIAEDRILSIGTPSQLRGPQYGGLDPPFFVTVTNWKRR